MSSFEECRAALRICVNHLVRADMEDAGVDPEGMGRKCRAEISVENLSEGDVECVALGDVDVHRCASMCIDSSRQGPLTEGGLGGLEGILLSIRESAQSYTVGCVSQTFVLDGVWKMYKGTAKIRKLKPKPLQNDPVSTICSVLHEVLRHELAVTGVGPPIHTL